MITSVTDPAPVLDLIEAFRRSKTMFAAVEMGVFDRLAAGPRTSAELGDGQAMERLLDACVALGFLLKSDGRYRNTPVADDYLRRESPSTLAGYILYSNEVLFRMWANLEDAVQEGTHRWRQTFGLDGPIFSHFFRTDAAMRVFVSGMHGLGRLSSPSVVAAFDLSRFRRLVDLGGATGHLALAACDRYPSLEAAVFDLPQVIRVASEHVAGSRVELIAGDFFTDPLPQADLYSVGRILHDWSEEKIHRLLAKVFAALPQGGGLLIAEKLLEEDKSGPVSAQMQSLNMLICTEGRERSLSEYQALLRHGGFTSVEGRRTGTLLDAVLGLKI